MKTKITFVVLLSLFAFASRAQYQAFYFGLKAAPQITWMNPDADNMTGNGSKVGFAWGLVAEKNFTENYSIASGFNMLFNGGKLSIKDADVSTFQILSWQGELAEDINSSYKYGLRIPKNIETTGQA